MLDPDTKRPVPIPVCFAAQGAKELMFVPAIFLEEAALFLQAYYEARPDSDKVQIISVVQSEDWAAVAQKAGPGIAGYKDLSNIRKERIKPYVPLSWHEKREDVLNTDGGINEFFEFEDEPYPWVRLCCKSWMHDAVDIIPSQEEIEPNNKWSCGINSAAKAIHMFGENMSETYFRNTFLPNAPKAFDRARTAIILAGMGEANRRAPMFSFLGKIVGDIYLAGAVAAASMPSDVGPTPKRLAEYITGYLPGTKRARYRSYDDFWECAEIIRDDLRRGDPVIVFWSFSPAKAHYVNVVGVSVDSNDLPEEFVIMEPNDNCLYRLSYQDMRLLMRREFVSYVPVTSWDDYHIVRFYR